MSRQTTAIPVDAAAAETLRRAERSTWLELAKPGITRLVTLTAAGGFALRVLTRPDLSWPNIAAPLTGVILGTAAASAGANALNMWYEADLDRLMNRTRLRPIPDGRVSRKSAFLFGTAASLIGVALLAALAGPLPAILTLLSVVLYVLAYTPLKTISPWCTLVGAVPGALPVLIGAAAASDLPGFAPLFDPVGLALFTLMTIWQLPHFLAIALMYKDDYAAANMAMLPVVDKTGKQTTFVTRFTALLFIPSAILPAFASPLLGWPYALIALLSSAAFAVLSWRVDKGRTAERTAFFASIAVLPLLMTAMVAEAGIRVFL